eukprot:693256-Prorocentrum_minimum.AAC.55
MEKLNVNAKSEVSVLTDSDSTYSADSDGDSHSFDQDPDKDDESQFNDIYSDKHHWDVVLPFKRYRFRPEVWCEAFAGAFESTESST